MKKILVAVTSQVPADEPAYRPLAGEAVHFVEKVEAAGYSVNFVSPKGGYTPISRIISWGQFCPCLL